MEVLVIGAGPAGCTAAMALARQGVRCTVVEVAPELRPVGVGLMLQNSPLRALDTPKAALQGAGSASSVREGRMPGTGMRPARTSLDPLQQSALTVRLAVQDPPALPLPRSESCRECVVQEVERCTLHRQE